ncbi:hypothetical protein [Arthrobacter sp. SO3]|uniref:hypothetical protein n=1 Tax=Arthrobacter sp. SO3 TaxID=1897057 RepID=UPI001CFFD0CC|nr:hypothetical protein [Arthrobacter sp. SO3]
MDGELFNYAASAEAVVRSVEYADRNEIIIDRSGNRYPLRDDENGHLELGQSSGKADFDWLREAWDSAQQEDPQRYPLERVMPDADIEFLASLFEMLEETTTGVVEGWTWKVRQPGRTHHLDSLDDVNELLRKATDLPDTIVQDPYEHLYRPYRMIRGTLALTDRHYLVYREEFPEDVPDA